MTIKDLNIEQLQIVEKIIQAPQIDDISLSIEDVHNILKDAGEVKVMLIGGINDLKKKKDVFRNAKKVLVLFELNNTTKISQLVKWMKIIDNRIQEDATLIFGTCTNKCKSEKNIYNL